LPAEQVETFALAFAKGIAKGIDKLNVAYDKLTALRQRFPSTLPEPLVEPKL
jgi:hypothetical protein